MNKRKFRILILGAGNPILSDDSTGLKIIDELDGMLNSRCKNIHLKKSVESGIALLDIISGYDRLIFIDSIKTGKDEIGTLTKHNLSDFKNSIYISNPHRLNLPSVIELAKKTGISIPEKIDIFTVEVDDTLTISTECTEKINENIPEIARQIISQSNLNNNAS